MLFRRFFFVFNNDVTHCQSMLEFEYSMFTQQKLTKYKNNISPNFRSFVYPTNKSHIWRNIGNEKSPVRNLTKDTLTSHLTYTYFVESFHM